VRNGVRPDPCAITFSESPKLTQLVHGLSITEIPYTTDRACSGRERNSIEPSTFFLHKDRRSHQLTPRPLAQSPSAIGVFGFSWIANLTWSTANRRATGNRRLHGTMGGFRSLSPCPTIPLCTSTLVGSRRDGPPRDPTSFPSGRRMPQTSSERNYSPERTKHFSRFRAAQAVRTFRLYLSVSHFFGFRREIKSYAVSVSGARQRAPRKTRKDSPSPRHEITRKEK